MTRTIVGCGVVRRKYSSPAAVNEVCVIKIFIPIVSDNRAPSVIQKRLYSLRNLYLKTLAIFYQPAQYSVIKLRNSWISLVFYSCEMNLDYRINEATFKVKFYYKKKYILNITLQRNRRICWKENLRIRKLK